MVHFLDSTQGTVLRTWQLRRSATSFPTSVVKQVVDAMETCQLKAGGSPLTPEEHIRKLYVDRYASKGSLNDQDFERSLDLLTKELYEKPTHFVLELIQNADDNHYARGTDPCLDFTLQRRKGQDLGGYLWVTCNEVGFTKDNVESICRIRCSTKQRADRERGYIGEKGIGFKAAFKIADVIWISSGGYLFKLDSRKHLGMVTPVWESSLPSEPPINARTIFCLHIPSEKDYGTISEHLSALKPTLLLFLRQLRTIRVNIEDASHPHNVVLSLVSSRLKSGRETLVILNSNESVFRFHAIQYTTFFMPETKKREGIPTSAIILAFPLTAQAELDNRRTQDVFSFLPVGNFGFPFLIQADFLLTTDRSSIDWSHEWNQKIRSTIAEAFKNAVDLFNGQENFRYQWPCILPKENYVRGHALAQVYTDIVKLLAEAKVLVSRENSLEAPVNLTYIPREFQDHDGSPLIPHGGPYLSSKYIFSDLKSLKVKSMDSTYFLKNLKSFISENHVNFHNKPDTWHTTLAEILIEKFDEPQIRDLEIIPLANKKWVAKDASGDLFFPYGVDGISIPAGIEVAVLDQQSCGCPIRTRLFEKLKVQVLDKSRVCELIIKKHREWRKHEVLQNGSVEMIVSHAHYLFLASYKIQNLARFWVYDEHQIPCTKGSWLYINLENKPNPISSYYTQCPSIITLIHPTYLDKGFGDKSLVENWIGWIQWLQDSLGCSTVPRLSGSNGSMSPEFSYLINNMSSTVFLTLLRDNWAFYLPNFEGEQQHKISTRRKISESSVKCSQGLKLLKNTVLPLPNMLSQSYASFCGFLDIPERNDSRWQKLHIFGVIVSESLPFYLDILRNLAENNAILSLEDVHQLYRKLYQFCVGQEDPLVVSAFKEHKLVYIFDQSEHQHWKGLNDCVWEGPEWFHTLQALKKSYALDRTVSELFLGILSLKQTPTVEDVIKELRALADMPEGWAKPKLMSAIRVLGQYMKKEKKSGCLDSIRYLRIFPVVSRKNEVVSVDLVSCTNADWFVADNMQLYRCFYEKVLLLDLKPTELHQLGVLIDEPELKKKMLSERVKELPPVLEQCNLYKPLMDDLRRKVKYILSLLPQYKLEEFRNSLEHLEVYSVSKVIIKRAITLGTQTIHGADDSGMLVFRTTSDVVQIFIAVQYVQRSEKLMFELKDRISDYLGGLPTGKKEILTQILIFSHADDIEEVLEKNRITWEKDDAEIPGAIPMEDAFSWSNNSDTDHNSTQYFNSQVAQNSSLTNTNELLLSTISRASLGGIRQILSPVASPVANYQLQDTVTLSSHSHHPQPIIIEDDSDTGYGATVPMDVVPSLQQQPIMIEDDSDIESLALPGSGFWHPHPSQALIIDDGLMTGHSELFGGEFTPWSQPVSGRFMPSSQIVATGADPAIEAISTEVSAPCLQQVESVEGFLRTAAHEFRLSREDIRYPQAVRGLQDNGIRISQQSGEASTLQQFSRSARTSRNSTDPDASFIGSVFPPTQDNFPFTQRGSALRISHDEIFDVFESIFNDRASNEINQPLRDIGQRGELFVFYLLRTIFGAHFPIHHWTSKSRARFGNLSFTGQEGDYSDFTFDDPNDTWTTVLINAGFDEAKGWKDRAKNQAITYHLEVKSTSGPFDDPFYMSFNQLQMAERWTLPSDNSTIPTHVYMIVRVHNVLDQDKNSIGIKLFVDPWRLRITGDLLFEQKMPFMVRPAHI